MLNSSIEAFYFNTGLFLIVLTKFNFSLNEKYT